MQVQIDKFKTQKSNLCGDLNLLFFFVFHIKSTIIWLKARKLLWSIQCIYLSQTVTPLVCLVSNLLLDNN